MTKNRFGKAAAATLAALGVLAAPGARAQEAAVQADRECIAVALYYGSHKKKDVRQFGVMAALYFLGRLEGRAPELATSEKLTAYFQTLTEADLLGEANRCLEEFEKSGDVFQGISFEDAEAK